MRFEIEHNKYTTAIQIPTVTSTLRKQFWLHQNNMTTSHSSVLPRAAGHMRGSRPYETFPGDLSHLAEDSLDIEERIAMQRSPGAFHSKRTFNFDNVHIHDTDNNAAAVRRRNQSGDTSDSNCSCPPEAECRRSSQPVIIYSTDQPIYLIQGAPPGSETPAQPAIERPVSRGQCTQTSIRSKADDDSRRSIEDTLSGEDTPIVQHNNRSPLASLDT